MTIRDSPVRARPSAKSCPEPARPLRQGASPVFDGSNAMNDFPPTATRLWFHLDDVLPIAAHAMACPRHAVTAAQLQAAAPRRPALIWHGDDTHDTLASNGLPGWHDQAGQTHTAHGSTWVHRPTRRRGVAAQPGIVRHGYVPLIGLNRADGNLFDRLEAEGRARRWLSIDVADAGAILDWRHLDLHVSRGDVHPPHAVWNPATVACVPEAGPGLYPALTAGDYTNSLGGEIALFDRTTIDHIAADLVRIRDRAHAPDGHVDLQWHGDELHVASLSYDLGGRIIQRWRDVVSPDRDGRYPLGAYTWTWLPINTNATSATPPVHP